MEWEDFRYVFGNLDVWDMFLIMHSYQDGGLLRNQEPPQHGQLGNVEVTKKAMPTKRADFPA